MEEGGSKWLEGIVTGRSGEKEATDCRWFPSFGVSASALLSLSHMPAAQETVA